jgi:hypothetical protein
LSKPSENLTEVSSCSLFAVCDSIEDTSVGKSVASRIIVSPAVKQSHKKSKRHCSSGSKHKFSTVSVLSSDPGVDVKFSMKKQRVDSKKFSSGNYVAYYGYRNADKSYDPRILLFSREMFEGKDVLDIGCNSGLVTLTIARDFCPKRIVGIDVDSQLIERAKRSVCHFLNGTCDLLFPASMNAIYGPVSCGAKPLVCDDATNNISSFPNNVLFHVVRKACNIFK